MDKVSGAIIALLAIGYMIFLLSKNTPKKPIIEEKVLLQNKDVFESTSVIDRNVNDNKDVQNINNSKLSNENSIYYSFFHPEYKIESNIGLNKDNMNGKFGVVDNNGNIVIEYKYDSIDILRAGDIIAKKNGLCGLLNKEGREITPFEYDDIRYSGMSTHKLASKNGKWGIIDNNGVEVVQFKYDKIHSFSFDRYAPVSINGKWGFVSQNGIEVIPCEYDMVKEIASGIATVCKNGKWGFRSVNGKMITQLEFDEVGLFLTGHYAIVCIKGRWGLMEDNGDLVIPCIYDKVKIIEFEDNDFVEVWTNGVKEFCSPKLEICLSAEEYHEFLKDEWDDQYLNM